jgi:hypothetical protein
MIPTENCSIALPDPRIEETGRWHASDANPATRMDHGKTEPQNRRGLRRESRFPATAKLPSPLEA